MGTVRHDILRLLAVMILLLAAVIARADDDLSMEAGTGPAPLDDGLTNLDSIEQTPAPAPEAAEPVAEEPPPPAATPEPLPPPEPAQRKVASTEVEYVEREKIRLWHPHNPFAQVDLAFSGAGESRQGATIVAGGLVAWRPTLQMARRLQFRGLAGLHMLKDYKSSAQFFQVMDFEALFALAADGGYIELGGGIQNWGDHGGSSPVMSVNLAAPFRRDQWIFFDRFYVGYSAFFGTVTLHEFRVGFGLALF